MAYVCGKFGSLVLDSFVGIMSASEILHTVAG
jgi:hypothetical protein